MHSHLPLSISMLVSLAFVIYTYFGYIAATQPNKGIMLSFLPIFMLGIAIVFRSSKIALNVAIFCMPFTQVPTAKVFFRWRITEIIAWFLAPKNLQFLLRDFKSLPNLVRIYVLTMVFYFLYTFLMGIIMAPLIALKVEEALGYTHHPFLRTILESARCLAIISLITGIIYALDSWRELEKYLRLFVMAGALSSLYGLYQTLVIRYSLPLALLPETLSGENTARPFSTFYEPTGLGSYTAASALLALYLIHAHTGRSKIIWMIFFILNIMGLWISLSRAGLIGLSTGIITLIIILTLTLRIKRLFSGIVISLLVLFVLYFPARHILSDIMDFGLSFFWLKQSMKERQESYGQLLELFSEYPAGVGQGNFLFVGAGAPGFARLFIEGGIFSPLFLLIMHGCALLNLTSILRSQLQYFRQIGPYLAATYISCFTTTANYISTTDSWIWFIWSLPAFACILERRVLENTREIPRELDIPVAAGRPA